MFKEKLKSKENIILFIIVTALVSLGMSMSDSVFGNYFKEVYHISAYQRGVLEFPREIPGLICLLVIGVLSFLGDIRIAIIAQALSFVGIMALGLWTPMYAVMTIYLFINSLGMHTFMPLRNSIGLSLIEDRRTVGKWLGRFGSVYTGFALIGGLIVFLGFTTNIFSFDTAIKWIFVLSGVFFFAALLVLVVLNKRIGPEVQSHRKIKIVFDKDYLLYYVLAIMLGIQKQVVIVFGPWVLIDLLSKGPETIAALNMIGGFICMLLIPFIGHMVDRFGIRRMLFVDAFSFIGVYLAYGVITALIVSGIVPLIGIPVLIVGTVFVMDKVSMTMDLIRVSYLRAIAKSDSDITHTLSTGLSLDHVVSIVCAYLGGLVWATLGPQYVFFFVAALSLINVFVAIKVKDVPHPKEASS